MDGTRRNPTFLAAWGLMWALQPLSFDWRRGKETLGGTRPHSPMASVSAAVPSAAH